MGCASSGPAVKDLAANAANGKAAENLKAGLGNAMEDAANLDFDKVEEDLMKVGEGLKDTVTDGVHELMDDVMGKSREDGDGGSTAESPAEGDEPEAGEPMEEGDGGEKEGGDEGLDSIEKDEDAEAVALEADKEEGAEVAAEDSEPSPGTEENSSEAPAAEAT